MLDDGKWIPILGTWTNEPLPVFVAYPQNRPLQAKVRVFVDWIAELFSSHATLR